MGRPVDTLRLAGLSVRAFAAVLCFGVLAGTGAFVWTLEVAPESERRGRPSLRAAEPDPAFGAKARQVYALGGFAALADAAAVRRQTLPGDPEGMLFGAFAHERMSRFPGLGALEHAAEADRLWADLLDWSRDPMRRFAASEYFEGWALLGLGRPVMARERWGVHLETARPSPVGIVHYNTACYQSLAGDAEAAQTQWRRAALGEGLDLMWSRRDPDLELIAGTFEFEVWYHWQRLRREERRMWRYRGSDGTPDPGLADGGRPVFLRTD